MTGFLKIFIIVVLCVFPSSAFAGLDLENQSQINIPDLDLDQDGRIRREEMARYMYFYFDHDGNEVLTKGEYHREYPIEILPYEAGAVDFIDLDNDGNDDGQVYTTESFLLTVMVDKEAAAKAVEAGQLDALGFIGKWFLNLDINKSRAIDLHEWMDEYSMHGVNKPARSPKAADNNRYSQ